MGPWIWDARAKRYRDPKTGRFVSERTVLKARDTYRDARRHATDPLTDALVTRQISLSDWQAQMREQVKTSFINQYLLGRGGRNAMGPRDWGILGHMLRDQYAFLRRFAEDIASGRLSPAQIAMRARMYMDAAVQAFERGKAEAHGLPHLDQYPGDGNTQCRANCQCHLEYEEHETTFDVYWVLGVAEHCQDCIDLEGTWDPLTVAKERRG